MYNHLALLLPIAMLALAGCADTAPGDYAYPSGSEAAACEPDSRKGLAGVTDGEWTAKGFRFNVRTPANYNSRFAHPLLMMFAPAGLSAEATERFTGLTKAATGAGFVVAYADHVRITIPVIEELSTIPAQAAKKWCIDAAHVYLTGHSDGGTVAMAIAVMDKTKHIPAAIAPNAAGFTKADLAEFKCRSPLPVMIMHSARDRLFPGFGAEAAAWWAACNRCDPTPRRTANGCVSYPNCAEGVTTQYCEGQSPHARWPGLNQSMIDFFTAVGHPIPQGKNNSVAKPH
jgi:polyhydroxybutyrate depolymerase